MKKLNLLLIKMQKLEIKNRKNQKIVVLLEITNNSKPLAFVMHGLGGKKEQPHIETFAQSFLESGYNVVRFDTTNTFGESEGDYENATTTNYYEDLEDVINWAKNQEWYQEPFVLAGHSLGGISIALYAEKYPEKVKALAPISTVVSGKLSIKAQPKETIEKWDRTGWRTIKSTTTPGFIKKLKWHPFKEDKLKYDLLENADKLTMPVLLIVGDKDNGTPPEHQKMLFEKLRGPKEMHIIKGAPHTFEEEKHLSEIKTIFKNWINKLN
jgi:pimeloyl-ACP methyl ester carboxylesterase